MSDAVNRYATIDLFIPTDVHDKIDPFVSASDKLPRPFERQVDLWWAGLALGMHIGTRMPMPMPDHRVKFNTGVIFSSDPWRITHLELLALAEEGPDVFDAPAKVIEIASEYANTGLRTIVRWLLGEAEPTLSFINRLGDIR